MVHYVVANGRFVICHAAATGSTDPACRWINREENEISRHYAKHHGGAQHLDYNQCRAVMMAAAVAFVGQKKVDKANEKKTLAQGGAYEEAVHQKTPVDDLWVPTPGQVAAAPVAALAAPANPPAAAPAPVVVVVVVVPAVPAAAPANPPAGGAAVNPPPAAANPPVLPGAPPPSGGPTVRRSAYNHHFDTFGRRV